MTLTRDNLQSKHYFSRYVLVYVTVLYLGDMHLSKEWNSFVVTLFRNSKQNTIYWLDYAQELDDFRCQITKSIDKDGCSKAFIEW